MFPTQIVQNSREIPDILIDKITCDVHMCCYLSLAQRIFLDLPHTTQIYPI
jgi:hypothetical protein